MNAKRETTPRLLLLLVFAVPFVAEAETPRQLLIPTNKLGSQMLERHPAFVRHRRMLVDAALLRSSANTRLRMKLFGGAEVELVKERQQSPRSNTLVWYGAVAGQAGGYAVLALVNDVLIGQVVTVSHGQHQFYEIHYLGNGVHALVQAQPSRYAKGRDPTDRSPSEGEETPPDDGPTCVSDPGSDIDLLVLYTPAARIAAGGQDAIEATIFAAVEQANQSYINSDITQRLRLTHVEEIAYTEIDDDIDLFHLQDTNDGVMDQAISIRNTHSADLVMLVVEYPVTHPYCGFSFIMRRVNNDQERRAYAVTLRDCAVGNHTLAHELGHVMGARHDWLVDPTNYAPYAYNHGYVAWSGPSRAYTTIMAYDYACTSKGITSLDDCTPLLYWSNPGKTYPPGDPNGVALGVPAGQPERADNHRTLNNTALTVANFRCSSRGTYNVWMKDTWNDTGKEPDPHTVGEDMWKSPYIWVRRSEDTQLTAQHVSEEAVRGATNWIYVKLENGGTDTTGSLEIYGSPASPGLPWPSDWTKLGTVDVPSFPENTVRVVGLPWTPTDAGHYCLLARWQSASDPMAVPETEDIQANVRNNNNTVWRNVFVVDLISAALVKEVLTLYGGGVGDERMATRLVIRASGPARQSFLRQGTVTLVLDDTLMRAWREGGARGRGLSADGPRLTVTGGEAVIDNLILPRGVPGHVEVSFAKTPSTPKGTYVVDFVQLAEHAGASETTPRVIGGVSYEIRTDSTGAGR